MAQEQAAPEKETKPEAPVKETKAQGNVKADLGKRVVAVIIDWVIAWVLAMVIPFLGGLIGAAYMLLRDGLDFNFMDRRSLGKKLMKLRAVTLDGSPVDINVSVKRNWVFAIGPVLMILPVVGWVLGSIVGFVIGIIEIVLVFSDEEGRRMGDKLANTKVIEVED
jgi:uncharacterized RDD family membrane protein YckC